MRKILAIFLIVITCSVSFASVSKSLEFPLILHKQGKTDLYFSLTEDGSSRETSIDNLVSTDNRTPATATFYACYSISTDIFSKLEESVSISLLFSATGKSDVDGDYMLVHTEDSDIGLVYDYNVSSVGNTSISHKFELVDSRDDKATKEVRKVILQDKITGENVQQNSKDGKHKIDITINPPSKGFTTGSYVGYVILAVEAS